jgi:hypothetical protein
MKRCTAGLLTLVILCGFAAWTRGDDAAPEKALKGTMACAKCVLHEEGATQCQSVLQVKDGDKTIEYYLTKNDVEKTAHPKCCTKSVENVTVTGTTAEKDGKMWVTASKIEFPDDAK